MGKAKLRVVIDTNVVLSALLFSRGSLAWLRGALANGAITAVVCRETLSELIRVLSYPKFQLSEKEIEALLSDFVPYTETVILNAAANQVQPDRCRDPHDEVFLLLAEQQHVDYLVSGDKDLLVLADAAAVQIVTPAALQALL